MQGIFKNARRIFSSSNTSVGGGSSQSLQDVVTIDNIISSIVLAQTATGYGSITLSEAWHSPTEGVKLEFTKGPDSSILYAQPNGAVLLSSTTDILLFSPDISLRTTSGWVASIVSESFINHTFQDGISVVSDVLLNAYGSHIQYTDGTNISLVYLNSINTTISHNLLNVFDAPISSFTGKVKAIALPTSNSGLSTGDMYVDTATNILANGDKIVGWKI